MNTEATVSSQSSLPFFIRVAGFLAIGYALLMFVGVAGAFIAATWVVPYWEKQNDFTGEVHSASFWYLAYSVMAISAVFNGLIFASGWRMAWEAGKKPLAEFCSLLSLLGVLAVNLILPELLCLFIGRSYMWMIALPVDVMAYFVFRHNLQQAFERLGS